MKKSAELRKRVLQRQEKNKEKSDSVSFQVFINFLISYSNKVTLLSILFVRGLINARSSMKDIRSPFIYIYILLYYFYVTWILF